MVSCPMIVGLTPDLGGSLSDRFSLVLVLIFNIFFYQLIRLVDNLYRLWYVVLCTKTLY